MLFLRCNTVTVKELSPTYYAHTVSVSVCGSVLPLARTLLHYTPDLLLFVSFSLDVCSESLHTKKSAEVNTKSQAEPADCWLTALTGLSIILYKMHG